MLPRSPTSADSKQPISIASKCLSAFTLVAFSVSPALFADTSSQLQDRGAQADLPAAKAIHIQLDDSFPAQGDTRVEVTYDRQAIERFEAHQGFRDYVTVGPEGRQMMLRDDGRGADDVAGDGIYQGMVWMEQDQLARKAKADLAAKAEGAQDVRFANRQKLSTRAIRPFDLDGFRAGERIELRRSSWVGAGGPSFDSKVSSPKISSPKVSGAKVVPGTNFFQEDVLAIRRPPVINDGLRTFDPCTGAGTAMGPWTFGYLMNEMANTGMTGVPTDLLINDWLAHWLTPQVINTFTAPNRAVIFDWIRDWRIASTGSPIGPLDPAIAPFRLLAILPRVDLREPLPGKTELDGPFFNAGEARFVFGAVVPPGWPSAGLLPGPMVGGCKMLPFTVIFEYGVPLNACSSVRAWANSWNTLNTLPYGSFAYLNHLEGLTHTFIDRNRDPSKPFGSALNQLRTNENAFDPLWELREFQLDPGPMRLVQTETADNADNSFQGSPQLLSYITDFSTGAVTEVPSFYPAPTDPFRTGNPIAPGGFFWDELSLIPAAMSSATPAVMIDARHEVSLASCNGCHAGEVATPFVHISPTNPLPPAPAALSIFMTGVNGFADPAVEQAKTDGRIPVTTPPVLRDFDALEDREADINAMSASLCVKSLTVPGTAWARRGETPPPHLFAKPATATFALEELLREPVRQAH